MDHITPKCCQSQSLSVSQGESTKGNPFAEEEETSEFVKSLAIGYGSQSVQRRREKENVVVWNSVGRKIESPSTPGRPGFSFSSRKNGPSKWDDAEKWLFSGVSKGSNSKGLLRENDCNQHHNTQTTSFTASLEDDMQKFKDKFTDGIELFNPNPRYSKPTKDAFFTKNQDDGVSVTEVVVQHLEEVKEKHRDIGTEMTPIDISTTTSRCPTPFTSTSPARHNTPASGSGLLAQTTPLDHLTKQLQDCHLDWSSREEEEEEISKSLRHFQIAGGATTTRSVSVCEPRPCAWELDEDKAKSCVRYQREEARIKAWVNLQTAKAEAQSRKLEVKIQKMRSELEEKLMKRMRIVHKRAEEWRAAAQVEHCDQIRKSHKQKQHVFNLKLHNHNYNSHLSPQLMACTCFRRTTS